MPAGKLYHVYVRLSYWKMDLCSVVRVTFYVYVLFYNLIHVVYPGSDDLCMCYVQILSQALLKLRTNVLLVFAKVKRTKWCTQSLYININSYLFCIHSKRFISLFYIYSNHYFPANINVSLMSRRRCLCPPSRYTTSFHRAR